MAYHQLTDAERYLISQLKLQGYGVADIAELTERHRSTIYRELARNRCKDGNYRVGKAIKRTRGRRSRSRRNRRFDESDLDLVWILLKRMWSPEQISNRLYEENLLSISHETIYHYIKKDKYYGGDLHIHLRHDRKQMRKGYGSADSRGVLRDKRHLTERPGGADRHRFRPGRPHADDPDHDDRRWRRLDRVGRPRRHLTDRAGKRRRQSRTRLLRPRQ